MKFYEDKEYQLMCEKAVEIQKLRPPQGQRLTCWMNGHGTWFPTQEDLQEIMKKELQSDDFSLLMNLYGYSLQNTDITLSQLWLAFVMYELYRKRWNPEKKEWDPET